VFFYQVVTVDIIIGIRAYNLSVGNNCGSRY